MADAPSKVDPRQLRELRIRTVDLTRPARPFATHRVW